MRKQTLLTAAAFTASLGLAAVANAAPILQVEVFDNGVLVPGSSVTSTTGSIGFLGSDANFSQISITAQGVPLLPNPDLSSVTINATASGALGLPATLRILVTQTSLTGFPAGTLQVADTSDALIGSITSVNQSTYLDTTNTAFGTSAAALLDSHTPVAFPDAYAHNYLVAGLGTFSETQQYTVVFATANSSYGGAMQLETVVPEPASLAIFGAALAGLGLIRRRRKTV